MPGNIMAQMAMAPAKKIYGKLGSVVTNGILLIPTADTIPKIKRPARATFQRLISLNNSTTVATTKPKKNDQINNG